MCFSLQVVTMSSAKDLKTKRPLLSTTVYYILGLANKSIVKLVLVDRGQCVYLDIPVTLNI